MTQSILVISAVSLVVAWLLLLTSGARWRVCGPVFTSAITAIHVATVVFVVKLLWDLPVGGIVTWALLTSLLIVGAARLRSGWSPPSQIFLAALILTSATFVIAAAQVTFAGELSLPATIGSVVLMLLEAFAFALLLGGTHEVLDVAGRVRWDRRAPEAPRGSQPFVSVHVATHNEPPDLVLETLRSLEALDYEHYEVVVIDNNTEDPRLWQPLKTYCDEVGFRFVHLADWPGYKSGALNYGLKITDPRAEIIAVVDSDFIVDPDFLAATTGYFTDPEIGIVQTAQAFRSDHDHDYLRRLELTYKTFDEVTMPSRNERNAIIFAGTMGLLRRSALVGTGGWAEWCVTEDAELSLRIIARGYKTLYVERSFGRGVMPLTFAALKRQRLRWCFGGVQILRRHWRLMLSGRGTAPDGAALKLTLAQRLEYLFAGLQWFQGLLTVIFSALLLIAISSRLMSYRFELRPLSGLFVAVPALLLVTGITRSVWGLRARLRVGWSDVFSVVGIWLGLTWAVASGCLQALSGREIPFFRTPKFVENQSLRQTLTATRVETLLAVLLFGTAATLVVKEPVTSETLFLVSLASWGGIVFACAPVAAFLAARERLTSPVLIQKRRAESIRGRFYGRRTAMGLGFVAAVLASLLILAGTPVITSDGPGIGNIFTLPNDGLPPREASDDTEERSRTVDRDEPSSGPGFGPSTTTEEPGPGGSPGSRPGAASSDDPVSAATPPPGSQATQAPGSQSTPASPDQKPSSIPEPSEPSQKPDSAPSKPSSPPGRP